MFALLLIIPAILVMMVLWVISLYEAITRRDLKNNQWLWVALIVLVCPIGTILYFFIENRKNYGIAALVAGAVVVLGIPLYAIISFALTATR